MANKLHAKKTIVDGIEFASGREAKRYTELKLLERAGKISNLQLQVRFPLILKQTESVERYGKNGKRLKDGTKLLERPVDYFADFTYTQDGKMIVEDSKGYRNPQSAEYAKFVIKRKLMLYVYGIKVREV